MAKIDSPRPVDVRTGLIEALRLDLVGPDKTLGSLEEVLDQPPSRFYLTGFLVPLDADDSQRVDTESDDTTDAAGETAASDDDTAPEPTAARQKYLPSSIGLSVLVPLETASLRVEVAWGDYEARLGERGTPESWARVDHTAELTLSLPSRPSRGTREEDVPGSDGLKVAWALREVKSDGHDGQLPVGTRAVSVFLINRRVPAPDVVRDTRFAFQTRITVESDQPFVPRPNVRSLRSSEWDERVADLQYRDVCEYAVGHNVATEIELVDGACRCVRTCWIPQAEVERVAPAEIQGVELSMDRLATLADAAEARVCLMPLVTAYRAWIAAQVARIPASPHLRKETGQELMSRASVAANRIEAGIELLADAHCLEAFRLANKTMAAAARQRQGVMQGKPPESVQPTWRPFQLAFLLMNLRGIAEPTSDDREVVDLLFFPTGGGKTEAYLGLAAFTLVLRRLQNPGIASAGVSVLMRYTLRLLTLDQLSRAATLICALELERQNDVTKLGDWPFEIGLWVGQAATPNVMGRKGDNNPDSARARTLVFKNERSKASPIPIEECPWCGTKFGKESFALSPNEVEPTDLRITCATRECKFRRDNPLPIVAVDEPIYRRLPCFLIATVDKFAAMPWSGEVGAFFGRVQRHDRHGFYGPCQATGGQPLPGERLLPPDLVIQDELHLISGPLGTIAGLYETALDELATREVDGGKRVRPKIVASTATVRRAENQIQALFNRRIVDIFPPPGPDRRDSFFAETHASDRSHPRLYVGVAGQGRSPKVVMLRVYVALLAAAQRYWKETGRRSPGPNPADAYMTLLGYFNSLRELGGARRLIEDEVRNRVLRYGTRMRVGETAGSFADRTIDYDPVELTSRESTAKVAEAKRRLSLPFDQKEHVDVAIATNMISVGLDITRLGLMVVYSQPKASAEYIQATSRVGRDPQRPGLVVALLNVHKPRDRSHFERFNAYHETFYRSVEATSVTPFSPRSLDRALAGTLVALCRHGNPSMTPPLGAAAILQQRAQLDSAVKVLAERAFQHDRSLTGEERERLKERVRQRAHDLLDDWFKVADQLRNNGGNLQYQSEVGGAAPALLQQFLSPELKNLPSHHTKMKFRANRSMRDVEPNVNLWLVGQDGREIVEDPS